MTAEAPGPALLETGLVKELKHTEPEDETILLQHLFISVWGDKS
jgi:hypothetical protein